MNAESLYWALSTLPQVGAALIAFIGFLVLDTLGEISRRCGIIENYVRDHIGSHPLEGVQRDVYFGYQLVRGEVLMEALEKEASKPGATEKLGTGACASVGPWKPLGQWRKTTRRLLQLFVGWNLLVMGVSLALLPLSETLAASYGQIAWQAWLAVITTVVASAVVVIWQVLLRPQP